MKQNHILERNIVPSVPDLTYSNFLKDQHILHLLPTAVSVCDRSGVIVNFNRKAAVIWGRTPVPGTLNEFYCGAYKIYAPSGEEWPHHATPVATTLVDGLPREDVEMIIERPDMSRVIIKANIVPIKDETGNIVGAINSFYDITAQKQAQKELDWKTKELKDYVNNAAVGLHWVDSNGIIKWANKTELDMLGYTEAEYIGHHISEFHADSDKIKDILHRLTCRETLQGYEASLRCKDGSIKAVQISSNVFWDNDEFIHTRCFTMDVTEQKHLFNALKHSESKYKQLINSLQAALYTTDAEGRIIIYNKAAAALWGREPEIGKDLWCGSYKIFNTDGSHLPLDSCPMAICLKEQRPVLGREILVARPDGSLRTVAPHPQPLFDDEGKMVGAINMLVDITHIKQTENALRESELKYRELAGSLEVVVQKKIKDLQQKNEELKHSEERYHKMIEEVEDYAIILLSKEGIIQNWNKGAENIKGYKEQEIVGKSFSNFYLPEDRNDGLPQKLLNQATEKGKAIHEGWRMRKDGTAFWGSIVLTALHDDQDQLIGFSKVTRDLTERKIAEDTLKEYTRQLEFQNKELEQFAYAASHDMKAPLRKIHFYNSFIAENTENVLDEKSKEFLQRSVNSVKSMNDLIDDLLTYSRTTTSSESFAQVDLNNVVNGIVLIHREEVEQKKVSFNIINLPVIYAIHFQVQQLMINLVNNAIKYKHPARDVVINISSKLIKGSEIPELQAETHRKYHKISVVDNGIGFSPEYADKIFQIFQRLNNVPSASGSGIGLALCKRIAQNHHGFITATGKENEGARFDVYLLQEV